MRGGAQVGRIVDAPASAAWELLVETARWPAWGPSIVAVEADPPRIRAGSRGRVKTRLGLWLPFEVDHFEEGRAWSWRVAGVRATGHRVEPVGEGRCRVVFEVPRAALPYAAVCWVALRRIERELTGR